MRPSSIRALFIIKLGVAVAWGYINIHHLGGASDPVALNLLAAKEHAFLRSNPAGFVKDLLVSPYGHYGNFFGSINSYWNDLDINIISKIIALFNFASTGNYYINALLGIFFSFFGHIALYRMYASAYPHLTLPIILGAFLIPTMLTFTSSNSKDNCCFTLMALTSFGFYQGLQYGFNYKKAIGLLLMFTGLLLIRNHIALLMVPALLAWFISNKYNMPAIKTFGWVYGLLALGVVITSVLSPSLNPARIIANKQAAFLAIPEAHSQLPMDTLNGSLAQLVQQTPQAINHGFLRPYLWEIHNIFNAALAAEVLVTLLLIAVVILGLKKNRFQPSPIVWYGIILSLTIILLTGFIAPNFNTIARYKSITLPFLLMPFLAHFKFWPKRLLQIKF